MSKSTGRSWPRKPTGTVTVIEANVHQSSARNAKLAFFVTLFVVGLAVATIAADRMHPILALLLGAGSGVASGIGVWTLVRVWPVIRLLWWWTPEILAVLAVVYGFTALASHTNVVVRGVVVALIVGVPALLPWARKRLIALVWCVIVRHRLRTCFAQFIISNRSGSLPLILWARPTTVGERIWVYLRPGLSLSLLESRLDQIAVACHAATVIVERAADSNAAYLRLDVKRRDALTATVASPLVDLVDPNTPPSERKPAEVPTALDLPDVPALALVKPSTHRAATNPKPAASAAATTPPVLAGIGGEDISDWV